MFTPRIFLIYSSNSKHILQLYKIYLKNILKLFQIHYFLLQAPVTCKLKTFLKSPHVNKKSKENFKVVIHKFKICLNLNYKIIKLFRCNVPKNIHLKIIYFNH